MTNLQAKPLTNKYTFYAVSSVYAIIFVREIKECVLVMQDNSSSAISDNIKDKADNTTQERKNIEAENKIKTLFTGAGKELEAAIESYAAYSGDEGNEVSAAPQLSAHIFRRIAAIVNAENRAKELMRPVYNRDKYFFNRNKMPEGKLTKEQLKEVNDFWAPYSFAYKNDPNTQRYFSIVSGRFDPSYISFGLHYHYLRKFWNTPQKVVFMSDKNNIGILFPDVKAPETIFHRIEGYYYDAERRRISEHEAQEQCLDIVSKGRSLILKPTQEGEGRGIVFLRPDKSRSENEKIFRSTGDKDYICQAVIENHESWRYSSCKGLNVARINTMNLDGTPEIMTSYLKMAIQDLEVVNVSLGALGIPINDDGTFADRAIDLYNSEWRYKLPDGSDFRGRKQYNYEKVKEAVLKMAGRIPELKAIAWDMTVDSEGNVMIIELNPSGGTEGVQVHGLHPYGSRKKLKEILDEYLIRRFYYERADWEWDYWEFKSAISIHKYDGLKKVVKIPEKLRGKPVTAIHANAFTGKNLEKIIVPESVKVISENAFIGCGKNCKVVLPERFSSKVFKTA